MRTAKYHDHAVLKVVILLILVVIGLFVYKTLVNQPCEHTADGNWIVSKEATCTEDGSRYKKCTKCGEHFDEQKVSALGHKVDSKEIVVSEPTCTKTGTAYKACSVCKEQVGDFITIPVIDHNPDEAVVENVVEHTATVGASYENVVYCKECKNEISREKVDVQHTVNLSTTTKPATCTNPGTRYTTHFCVECDKPINVTESPIAPLGHNFQWNLSYDAEACDFVLSGKCTRSECNYHEYDPTVDTAYSYIVEKSETLSVAPTCVCGVDTFVATIYLNEQVIGTAELSFELDPVMNHTIITKTGDEVDFMTFVQYDNAGKPYINISTYGIYLIYTVEAGQTDREARAAAWDENGFANGVFKCTTCNEWIAVRVYNDLAN